MAGTKYMKRLLHGFTGRLYGLTYDSQKLDIFPALKVAARHPIITLWSTRHSFVLVLFVLSATWSETSDTMYTLLRMVSY